MDRSGAILLAAASRRAWVLACALLLSAATVQVRAQAPAPGQEAPRVLALTFDEAQARLVQVSDALAAADAHLRGKQDLSDAARHLRLPEISLEARYLEFQKTLDLPLGSLAPVAEAFGIDSPLRFQERDRRLRPVMTAVLPLYTGGQIPAAQAAAAAAVRGAEAERAQQAQALVSRLVEVYFGLRLAEQALDVRRDVLDGLERHLAQAIALEREGFATRAQVLQATVARDASARAYGKASHDRDAAAAALALMLRSEGPVAPATPLFVIGTPLGTQQGFTRAALDRHPQLAQLRAQDAQAGEGVRVQQAALKPQVFLFGQYDLYRRDALLTDSDWAYGVGLRYTLLSGSDRRRKVGAARAQQDQAQAALREAQNRIEIGVAQAWHALETARQQYLLLDSSIEHAREHLRLQELSFREGQSTSLDVIDARLGLGGALVERAQAAYEYAVSLARLLELSGQSARFDDYVRKADFQVPSP
jgi:outer membrane protein TolC